MSPGKPELKLSTSSQAYDLDMLVIAVHVAFVMAVFDVPLAASAAIAAIFNMPAYLYGELGDVQRCLHHLRTSPYPGDRAKMAMAGTSIRVCEMVRSARPHSWARAVARVLVTAGWGPLGVGPAPHASNADVGERHQSSPTPDGATAGDVQRTTALLLQCWVQTALVCTLSIVFLHLCVNCRKVG
jgi:hypothetical protein